MINQLVFENENTPQLSNFKVKEVTVFFACRMNKLWHSRLPNIHPSNIFRNKKYYCFGIFYKDECYAVAIFSSPISRSFDGTTVLELRRYAIKDGSPKNTATWGLSKMIGMIKQKDKEVIKLISYQDTDVHNGTIYKAANWKPTQSTKFTSWGNSRKRNKDQATGTKVRWEFELRRGTLK